MLIQFAGGPGPIEPLESLNATLLVLTEVGSEGVLGDPRQAADLLVGQSLALEVDGLHPHLGPGMRVVEPRVVEGVNVLRREVDEDHRRESCRDSRGPGQATSLRWTQPHEQPSNLSRGQYSIAGRSGCGVRRDCPRAGS